MIQVMDDPAAPPFVPLERLKQVVAALMAVPKSAVEIAEAKRLKKASRKKGV
jgi:hypothetical protein